MKSLLAFVALSVFLVACESGNDKSINLNDTKVATADTSNSFSDSVGQTGDTSALNMPLGDSTSSSGLHGQGSGSNVGGGKTGAPQEKKGK